jgi:biofilm PGA synthesis N-glycosyltransferase PgaC
MDAATILVLSLGLVAYVHVGYPALVWAAGRVRRRSISTSPDTPPLAVVIAAYNEAEEIGAKVRNTLALDYPADRLHLVIVCDGSTDDTAARARQAAGARATVLHAAERLGKGAAMNRGVDATDAPIIVFSDANALYQPHALRALASAMADPGVGLASGRKTVASHADVVSDGESLYW